jgi:hypothetical protein
MNLEFKIHTGACVNGEHYACLSDDTPKEWAKLRAYSINAEDAYRRVQAMVLKRMADRVGSGFIKLDNGVKISFLHVTDDRAAS